MSLKGLPAWLQEGEESVSISVRVVPRAKRSEIVGTHAGSLKVRLAAPPVDGAANSALIGLLADRLKTRKRDVTIVRGRSTRQKSVRVERISATEVLAHIKPSLG